VLGNKVLFEWGLGRMLVLLNDSMETTWITK